MPPAHIGFGQVWIILTLQDVGPTKAGQIHKELSVTSCPTKNLPSNQLFFFFFYQSNRIRALMYTHLFRAKGEFLVIKIYRVGNLVKGFL